MTDTNVTTIKPPIVVLRERLQERRSELKNALTDIDPDHFIRALVTSAQIDPGLQACTFQSLWLACMRACRDNLLPDGREGAIIPFKDRATWVPMYQGLLKKFRASGQCRWITAEVVRKGERFERWIDQMGEHFHHVPDGDDNAPVEKVYAAATTKDGAFYVAVLSVTEINKIKAVSKATRDDSPWKMWPAEMMKKTALRRLSKLLPSGRDLFEEEDEHDSATESDPAANSQSTSGPPPGWVGTWPADRFYREAERSPGAAAALEQFAGGVSDAPTPAASEGSPAGAEAAIPAVPDAQQNALLTDHYHTAYERGQIAKASGAQRRAIPGEYRDEANLLEAEAWHAGYDGKRWLNPETGETLGDA
jgi:phage RecT family recombinase